MNEIKTMLGNPRVREHLQKKLQELKAQTPVKVDAELVDEQSGLPAIKKPKFMDLATSQHYVDQFLNKTPKEINEFIDKQSDLLMMYSKNAALELLAKALESNDREAMEMYLQVIQASAVVAQEKANVKKLIGVEVDETPKQYKAPEMSQEEWQKSFKPGQPLVPAKPEEKVEQWVGPTPKSVN
jgi:hypothetical protein